MSTGKKIICCGSLTWCKVIAWFNIIGNLAVILFCIIAMADLLQAGHTIDAIADVLQLEHVNVPISFTQAIWFQCFFLGLVALFGTIGIGFAYLLLKGANEKNAYYLRVWIIFATIGFVLTIVTMFKPPKNYPIALLIVEAVIDALAIIIVCFAKSEIEGSVSV